MSWLNIFFTQREINDAKKDIWQKLLLSLILLLLGFWICWSLQLDPQKEDTPSNTPVRINSSISLELQCFSYIQGVIL